MEDIKNPMVEDQSTEEIVKAISNDQNAIPYTPMSELVSMGTVIPLNLAGETMQAQFKVMEDIPNIDDYLVEKLGYSSKYALSEAFSAEQADAVAMAIRQIEKGKGFILADMAGIGKGRVNAGVLRFAYVNGYLPLFITEKPNLFSALYRDLVDIGGLETKVGGKPNFGYPLILNGFKTGGTVKTYDDNGKKTITKKPSETGIINAEGKEVITAPAQDEIKKIIKKDVVPKAYDYMMLTYSQLAGAAGKLKVDYLLRVIDKLDRKVVLCIDECHNAAGTKSDVGKSMADIVSLVQGVLFSSATFSKRPDNMFIYGLKTDISESPVGTKGLIDIITAGGERLTENLAASLVEAQQMIRRERTFENCNVEYNYMSDEEKVELFSKYDGAIKLYRSLTYFFTDYLFVEAKIAALKRFALEKGVELVTEERPKDKNELKKWKERNDGKYTATFSAGEIKRSQFQFIETLLFALKADFVANQTLSQLLNNKLKNLTVTKVEFESNRKPVIAVRNTLEGVYFNLGVEVGDEIEKADFSMYVYSLALGSMNGSITLKELKADSEKPGKKIEDDINVQESDFGDNGEAYRRMLADIKGINLDIPLSPIDYIINKIESTPRPDWDMAHGNGTPFFKVGEVTGRKFTLVPQKNGAFKLETNKKPKNKSTTFKDFNSGIYDVLLINESGSTGEDAHSSSRFKDQRPRVMIIHQVELDVNTEVQKRGRINRTGMVNYPNYIYAVSRIPSEIRRLLMLVRKLRSLDANTTANQKQSAKLSQIRDGAGNEILDVINKYGDECLQEFISVPENQDYTKYMPTDAQEKLGALSGGGLVIESFIRNLEIGLSEEQEKFYNVINELYAALKKQKEEAGEYDLETNIVDLKAAIKTRVLVSKGINTNPFNTSVYEEDDYVLAEDKPYNREKVESLIIELSKGQDPDEFYGDFLEDYKANFLVHVKQVAASIKLPDYDLARDEMQKMEMEAEYELRVKNAVTRATEEYEAVLSILEAKRDDGSLIFNPNRAVVIPAILEECYETDEDGLPMKISELNNGKFIGIRILKTAQEKYSPMNIEMIFCQLSGKPKLILKPTSRGREILQWIMIKTMDIDIPRIIKINAWDVDPNKRTLTRMLTGNILGAYGIAKETIARNPTEYSPVINFVKFTTADGSSIRLGIRLNMKKFQPLRPDYVPVQYPLNSKDLISDLLLTPKVIKTVNAVENFKMEYDPSGGVQIYIFGGTRKEVKGKNRKYFSKLYDDGEFINLLDKLNVPRRSGYTYYYPVGSENKRATVLKFLSFNFNLNYDADKVKEIFEYIYSVEPFYVSLRGIESEETIFDKIDIFNPDLQEGEEEDVEGIFKYDTVKPYDTVSDSIVNFSKFEKFERTSAFGTVYLKKRANIREVISYGLIPLDNTVKNMVSDTFQVLTSDTEKVKLNGDIEKAINEDKNDYQLGSIVKKALQNKANLQFIFGLNTDIVFIGSVFRAYAKGEIELPEKQKQDEQQQQEERKEIPLNMDTAQKFMILFTYKVKN